MRKITLYIAASLDGYIARTDGSIDWLENESYIIKGEDFGYKKFMRTVDTTLMGNNTYKVVMGLNMPFPYSDKTNFVFSRSVAAKKDNNAVQFIQKHITSFVNDLKQQEGKTIWLIGGGQINTLLWNAGLIDEVIITYIPVVLGEGIPLFAKVPEEKKVNLVESKIYANGFVQVKYNVTNIH